MVLFRILFLLDLVLLICVFLRIGAFYIICLICWYKVTMFPHNPFNFWKVSSDLNNFLIRVIRVLSLFLGHGGSGFSNLRMSLRLMFTHWALPDEVLRHWWVQKWQQTLLMPLCLVAVLVFAISWLVILSESIHFESLEFVILGLEWPQQSGATWCQRADHAHEAGTELPFLASVHDIVSPTELQSAHKPRLVLPSASWAVWWYDNARFSNPHEINCLHFWKKLDHNVPFCLHFCHSPLVNQRWLN